MKSIKSKIIRALPAMAIGAGLLLASGCVSNADYQSGLQNAKEDAVKGMVSQTELDNAVVQAKEDVKIEPVVELPILEITETSVVLDDELLWDEEYFLGSEIVTDLDDYNVVKLIRDVATFDGKEYDSHEELRINLRTVTSEDSQYRELGSEVRLAIETKPGVELVKEFDEVVTDVPSTDKPIEFKFAGRDFKVVGIDGAKVNLEVASSKFLTVGQQAKLGEKIITLLNVGSDGAVIVAVDGTTDTISKDTKRTINGVEIRTENTFYTSDTKVERSATLVIGKDIGEVVEDGEPAELFGYDKDDNFVYTVKFTSGDLSEFGLRYDEKLTNVDKDDKNQALKVGETLDVADYISVVLGKVSEPRVVGYDLDIDGAYVKIRGDEDYSFKVNGIDYKEVWAKVGTTVLYDKNGNSLTVGVADLGHSDKNLVVDVDSINIGSLEFNYALTTVKNGATDLSGREDDVLLSNGITIKDPKGNIENNEAEITIAEKDPEATVEVRG